MPDNNKILVGAPRQTSVSGAISRAPLGTELPTSASAALAEAFKSGGYVDESGVSLSTTTSTKDIKDWSGALVRKVLESFAGQLTFTYLEFADEESLRQQYGDDYVTVDAAKKDIKVAIGNHLGDVQSWAIDVKDGDNAVRLLVPRGQVTANGDISFVSNDAVKSQTTLTCYDDGTGNSLYIMVNGEVVSK